MTKDGRQDARVLTRREREVGSAYAAGEGFREIADRLCIAPTTVRTHLQTIYRKLGVSSKLKLRDALLGAASRPADREPAGADVKPVILVETFSQSGGSEDASTLAVDLQTQLVDALSHRTGVRVAVTSDQSLTPTYLLRGRVRISGHSSRVYLSMVAVESGEAFWTETLDDEISDVFAFLDRTTEKVTFALRTHFNSYAGAAYAARPDHELNTQQLLSKAAHLIYRFDAENAARSQVVMEAALQRSPESAIVLAMYSYTLMQTVPLAIHRPDEIDRERASRLADRAVSLGPDIDFVFHNRAKLRLWLHRDFDGCRDDADRILEVNPTYQFAVEDRACADIFAGRRDEGLRDLEGLVEKVPRDPINSFRRSILAIGHSLQGDMDRAIDFARSAFEQKPFVPIHLIAYSVAASPELVKSPGFRRRLADCHVTPRDADRIPLSTEKDARRLAELLRSAFDG